jgi:hypothetical protein
MFPEVARVKVHDHQSVPIVLLVMDGCDYELTTSLLADKESRWLRLFATTFCE